MLGPFFKKIIFLFFIIILKTANAQFFGLLYKDPGQYYKTALSEPRDGKYRVLNLRQIYSDGSINKNQVLVYNQNLQFVDSVNLLNGASPIFDEPLKIGNKLYWSASLVDTLTNNQSVAKLVVLELDSNYHHLACHSISDFAIQNVYPTNILFFKNHYYVCKSNIFAPGSTVYKLNNQFIKIDSLVLNNSLVQQIITVNKKLFLIGTGLPQPCSPQNSNIPAKLEIDTLFNLQSCHVFSVTPANFKIIPISNTKYFFAGIVGIASSSHQILENDFYDFNDNLIDTNLFDYPNKYSKYLDYTNHIAVKQNEILTTACIGFNPLIGDIYQPQKSKIFVNKLDTIGNLIWKKEYGGDMFYYPMSIVFTGDGGCLVSGLRNDTSNHQFSQGIMESFLLKLDVNGNYQSVGIMENGILNKNPIKCFPNPAQDKLYFDVPFEEEIEITIYNALGETIINTPRYTNLKEINTSILNTGAYLYRIKTKSTRYSGKFMKQ